MMSWPFERGRIYNRRVDIHARYRGQQQGGIITPAEDPLVIIITGEEGQQHGYSDRLRDDGVFEYFGEGQLGDMLMLRGNRAIADHSASGKSLLLFQKEKTGALRYQGEWVCAGIQERQAPDRGGQLRKAFVFELQPLEGVEEAVEAEPAQKRASLIELRVAAIAAASQLLPRNTCAAPRSVYQRSRAVREYVLARADGFCEGCAVDAPFLRPDGTPYLEPHHLRRVGDGGPDDPRFVIGLCPNCHRRVHLGSDGRITIRTYSRK